MVCKGTKGPPGKKRELGEKTGGRTIGGDEPSDQDSRG